MTEENISAIRARLKFKNLDEFGKGYARYISSGGIFIPMSSDRIKPIGTLIRFQFLLHDGSTALLGEGRVHQVRAYSKTGSPPVGMLVKFTKLSQTSKQLVDQIVRFKQKASVEQSSSEAQTQEGDDPSAASTPLPPETEQGYTSLEEETRAGPSPQDATPTRHLEPGNQPSNAAVEQADDAPTKDGDDAPARFGADVAENPFASRAETRTSSEPLPVEQSDPPTREVEQDSPSTSSEPASRQAQEEEDDDFFGAFDLGLSNPSIVPSQAPSQEEEREEEDPSQQEEASAAEAKIYDQALFGDSDVVEQPEPSSEEASPDASSSEEPQEPQQESAPDDTPSSEEGSAEILLDAPAEEGTPEQQESLDTSEEQVDEEASIKLAQETLLEPSSEPEQEEEQEADAKPAEEDLALTAQEEEQETDGDAESEQDALPASEQTESSAEILLDEALLDPPSTSSEAENAEEEEAKEEAAQEEVAIVEPEEEPEGAPEQGPSPQPEELADASPSKIKARPSSIKLPPPPTLPGPPSLPKPPGMSGAEEEVDLGLLFADDEGDSLFDDILMPGISASAKPLENPGNYNQLAAKKQAEDKIEEAPDIATADAIQATPPEGTTDADEPEQEALPPIEPPLHTQETMSSPEIILEEEESLDDMFQSLEPPSPPEQEADEAPSLDAGTPPASFSQDAPLPPAGPRKLAQTEGGLQVLAYDQSSAFEDSLDALSIADDAEDIDLMFDGIFGGSGGESEDDIFGDVFGGGAQEDVSLELLEPASPATPEEEEPSKELSSLLDNLESDEDELSLDVNHLDLQGPSIAEEDDEPSPEEEEESLAALLESARQDIDKIQQQKEEEEPDDTLLTNLLGEEALLTPDEPESVSGLPPLPDTKKKEKKGGLFSKLFKKD